MRSSASVRPGLRGFSLVELAIVLALTAIATVLAGKVLVTKAEEQIAEGVGSWMLDVRDALHAYEAKKFEDLRNESAGRKSLTIAELKAENLLPASFPETPPNGSATGISVVIDCTSAAADTCNALGLVYTLTPYVSRFTGNRVRLDLASVAMRAMHGRGAISWADNPGVLRGPSLTGHPNPVDGQMGIVAAVAHYTPSGSQADGAQNPGHDKGALNQQEAPVGEPDQPRERP